MPNDDRIETLTREIDRLRKSRHLADNQLQELVLKVTEIQLNLATQDRTLGRLDAAVNGNGRPGVVSRVDAVERTVGALTRATWLLATAAATAAMRLIFSRFG
jgi:hypothetical protein